MIETLSMVVLIALLLPAGAQANRSAVAAA
jgi:hypothetical protein